MKNKGLSELSVEEIREKFSKVTDEQKAETQERIKRILDGQKESKRNHYTSFDDVIQQEQARF